MTEKSTVKATSREIVSEAISYALKNCVKIFDYAAFIPDERFVEKFDIPVTCAFREYAAWHANKVDDFNADDLEAAFCDYQSGIFSDYPGIFADYHKSVVRRELANAFKVAKKAAREAFKNYLANAKADEEAITFIDKYAKEYHAAN